MAEERQVTPPLRKPTNLHLNPVHTDSMFVEMLNRDDPAYTANAPIKRGTLYSTIVGAKQEVIDQFPNLYFVQETQVSTSDQLILWRWTTDPSAEDTYNAEISYALESVTSPTYARTYTIRRDVYDNLTPIAMGTPLTGLIGVKIVDGGQDYTYATGTIDTDATIEFVVSGGEIISGVVTGEGSNVASGGQITIIGDGALAEATAIIQPSTAVLIGQKKSEFPADHPLNEEYVRVTRIYQTLPGPTIHSTQLHVDGVVVDVATTLKVASTITSGETLVGSTWTITTKTQDDNAYTGKEIVITREVPGNPVPYTKLDDDGIEVSGTRTLKDTTAITTSEVLATSVWTKTYKEFLTTRLTIGEEASDLVSWEVVEFRDIPGANIVEDTIDERDGAEQVVVRSMVDQSVFFAITPKEYIDSGLYTTIESKAISGSSLVVWQIVTTRKVPGNDVVKTVIDSAGDIVTETRTIVEGPPTLVTTISTSGGVYTKTFGEPITDIISWQVVQVKPTQAALDSFEVSIPDLLPEEFAATLPVTTHEETVIGFASLPTLATGDLMRRQAQIDYNTYRLTIRGRADISLPQEITNKEITSEFGGGEVNRVATLDLFNNLTLDQGLIVLDSNIRKLDSQANGLAVKTTRQLNDSAWPILPSRLWDENMRLEYDETKQTIDTGTAEDPNPGVFAWVSEVKAYDRWKANKTNTSKDAPQYVDEASALIHYEFKPFKFPGLLTPTGFGYYVRSAFAELIQHKFRTWWLSSVTTPTVGIPGSGADVEVEEILPDNVVISTLNDVTVLAYSGMVLHDDLTTFGTLFWPETTPNYTDYLVSWQGFEKVIAGTITPEKEKNVWKIVTESVIMR